MKEKDNITDFSERKKTIEEKRATENSSPNDGSMDDSMKKIFDELGISMSNRMLEEILRSRDADSLIESLQSGKFSIHEMQELMDGLKAFEDKLSQEKKSYRAFGQWIAFHKPYNLSTLFPIEMIRGIADSINISYTSIDSKNNIIEKIQPELGNYLSQRLRSFDEEMLNLFGEVIYSDGKKLVEQIQPEEIESKIDYLHRQGLVSRIKENGKHYLIIPDEFYQMISSVDFAGISRYNRLNTIIVRTTIAFANSYGAYPKALLYSRIAESASQLAEQVGIDLQSYTEAYVANNFATKLIGGGLYPTVIIGEEYISHGVVEFTKYLIDIQNENITEYRRLTDQEIMSRGTPLYYDDSISLNQIVSILQTVNALDKDDLVQLNNLIFTFSYLEFEPNLILQILDARYDLPEDKEYGKLLEFLRGYYKNGEKWILKGNTSFEVNNKNVNYDASKIVKIDFMNK